VRACFFPFLLPYFLSGFLASFILTLPSQTRYPTVPNLPADLECRFAQSPDLFASTCTNLFARMLDTVPKGVQLTDVITPLPVKPNSIKLIYDAATETIMFSGEVRVRDLFWFNLPHSINICC
jgi:hypothetical protein